MKKNLSWGQAIALITLLGCVIHRAAADQYPLWEAGAGLALIDFPDYRGADHRSTYLLPYPYIVYRGETLKVDGDRIRGLFFASERIEFDFSAHGSIPANSSDNETRRDMPDLDPTIELGPSVNVSLAQAQNKTWELQARFPLRAVLRTDLSYLKYTGWLFHPHLNLDLRLWRAPGWNFGVAAGPLIADRRYHEYFYSVDPAFATADRPAYSAGGGYSGLRFTTALSKRFPRFWVGAFIRCDSISGAVFDDSPLVRRKNDVSAGIGIGWIFAESKTLVEADK